MIQRVQTLYLLLTFGLLISLFFNKLCYTPGADPIYYTDFVPFLILTIASAVIAFFTIFLYRHRMIQIRMSLFNAILLLCFQGWIGYAFFTREEGVAFSVSALFPVICAILTLVALKKIAQDEAMVRSANSIRRAKKNRK